MACSRAVEGVGEKKANARRTAEAVGTISELVGGNVASTADSVWKEIEDQERNCRRSRSRQWASRKTARCSSRARRKRLPGYSARGHLGEQLLLRVVSRGDLGHVENCRKCTASQAANTTSGSTSR